METPRGPRHRHRAKAAGRLRLLDRDRSTLARSSILDEARSSGLVAARRAGEFLPRTVDAELTRTAIEYEWRKGTLEIEAFVEGVARDDLGARALFAVNTCAANIVDQFDGELRLEEARVTMQSGGLGNLDYAFEPPVRVGMLVVSDAVVEGHKENRAGEVVATFVDELEEYGVRLAASDVIGDDEESILERILEWRASGADIIFTVGGTGLTHTDVTVEAVESILDRPIPGIAEAIREYGREQTPLAFMSRTTAGLSRDTLVVALPGSTSGARESMEAIVPAVLHVVETRRKSSDMLED